MADINIERKRPSIWPWVVGLLVLALLIWAIAEMVDTDRTQEVAEGEAPVPPAAVPTPQAPGTEVTELTALAPLGPEDRGRRVRARGQVVAQRVDDGFWLLTDQDELLFVVSEQRPSAGETLEVVGMLEPSSEEEADRRLQEARVRPAAGWKVHRDLRLKADQPATP